MGIVSSASGNLFLALWTLHISGVYGTSMDYFYLQTGNTIKREFVYLETESVGVLHCGCLCAWNESCLTASYNEKDGICRLSAVRVNGPGNQERLEDEQQWISLFDSCLEGWTDVQGVCYYFYDELVEFHEAKDFCSQAGGKLAEPLTLDSFELLRNFSTWKGGYCHWIGLTDMEEEGRYVWTSTGEVSLYTAWGEGEPNQEGDANCICLYAYSSYRWADGFCTDKYNAICESQ